MKLVIICCVTLFIVTVYSKPDGKYTTKFDNVDIDAIIKSDRLLRKYIDCLTGQSGCNKDGQTLKELLPEALKNKCEKCSEVQKNGAKKIIRYMLEHKKDWWDEVEAVFDPDGTYRKAYEKELKEELDQ